MSLRLITIVQLFLADRSHFTYREFHQHFTGSFLIFKYESVFCTFSLLRYSLWWWKQCWWNWLHRNPKNLFYFIKTLQLEPPKSFACRFRAKKAARKILLKSATTSYTIFFIVTPVLYVKSKLLRLIISIGVLVWKLTIEHFNRSKLHRSKGRKLILVNA